MADGIFSKLKILIGAEEETEEEEVEEVKAAEVSHMRSQPAAVNDSRKYAAPSYQDRSSTFVQPKMEPRDSKVVSMQTNNNTAVRKQQFKLVVTEPKSFDECPKLVDSLKSKKPIIINLENLENEKARKIFDFLSGAAYALNGNVQKVANNIFVFAPENVDVLSNNGESSTSSKGGMSIAGSSPWRR